MLYSVLVVLVPCSVSCLQASSAGYDHEIFREEIAMAKGLVRPH